MNEQEWLNTWEYKEHWQIICGYRGLQEGVGYTPLDIISAQGKKSTLPPS